MSFKFSKKSLSRLEGVHPDLVKVVKRALALSTVDFSVNEGLRTKARQVELYKAKKTQTLNSNHLVQSDGYGHAVDLIPYPVSWDLDKFYPIAEAVQKACNELNITVRWGGAWINLNGQTKTPKELCEVYSYNRRKTGDKVFIDAPHFELPK